MRAGARGDRQDRDTGRRARGAHRYMGAGVALLLSVLLLAVGGGAAWGGAWPRGKGHHFGSGAYRLNFDDQGNSTPAYTYYHEYGLTDRWTIGVDVGGAISGFDKAVFFVSRANDPVWGIRTATDFGVGTIAGQTVMRPGFAIGRGVPAPLPGWISLEGATEYFVATGATDWKLDLTWGADVSPRAKLYVQLQTGQHYGDDPFARLAGSVAWRLTDQFYIDLGAARQLRNSDPLRLKIGFWWER